MKLLYQIVNGVCGVMGLGGRKKARGGVCGVDELEGRWMLFGGGVVTVSVGKAVTFEGNGGATAYAATFTVSLSGPAFVPVTVNWVTESGTAVAGVDFTAGSGTVAFAAGTTIGTIAVGVLGNPFPQPDRTFYVRLTRAVGAPIARGFAVGKIVDDDPARVSVVAVTPTANEAKGVAGVFRFTRTGPADVGLRVFYGVEGTAKSVIDYTKIDQSVLIPAGKASVDVSIKPVADNVVEGTESVSLRLKRRVEYKMDKAGWFATVNIVDGDGTAPTAGLVASALTVGGGAFYQFTVKYTDELRMDLASVSDGNIQVTGPNKYSPLAELVSKSLSGNKKTVTAEYQAPGPVGGVWSAAANGTYTVKVLANQVKDGAGNGVAAASVGTFAVQIPDT